MAEPFSVPMPSLKYLPLLSCLAVGHSMHWEIIVYLPQSVPESVHLYSVILSSLAIVSCTKGWNLMLASLPWERISEGRRAGEWK